MYLNNTRQWCRLAERGYLSYFSLSLFLSFLRLVIWVLLHRNSSAILGCQSLCPIGSNSVKLTPRQETGEKENGSAPMIDGKNRKRDVDKMWSRDVGRKDSKRLGGRSVRSIGDHLILAPTWSTDHFLVRTYSTTTNALDIRHSTFGHSRSWGPIKIDNVLC